MSKSIAVRSGNTVFLREYAPRNELEVGVYRLVPATPIAPTHLEDFSNFNLPNKIYGESLEYLTNKVLKSFSTYKKSVGVLLSGLKGTGKSLQLKHIALNSKMPVLIVDTCINGSELMNFLEKVPTSCVVLFDEFEKVYPPKQQETILPLLDGLSSTPHIFVLTVNDSVSQFLVGRPSRIRYYKKYSGLEEPLIKEIANDLLVDKSKTDDVAGFLSLMPDVNMDMVVAFIQDVNLYPEESPEQIIKTFNLEDPLDGEFTIVFSTPGLVAKKADTAALVKNKVYQYIQDKYNITELNPKRQLTNPETLKSNEEIMKDVVATFPQEVTIKNMTGSVESDSLYDSLEAFGHEQSFYLNKYFGEFINEDCVFEPIYHNYIGGFQNVRIKKEKNNTIIITSDGQPVAVARKFKRYTHSIL